MTGSDMLRAVLLDPDDDLARLAWADWLEESGEGWHASFVRAQLQVAPFLGAVGLERRDLTEGWAGRTFLPQPGQAALAWLRAALTTDPRLIAHVGSWKKRAGARFRRGLVEHVEMPLGDFLRHAGAIFAAQPVTSVEIADRQERGLLPTRWRRVAGADSPLREEFDWHGKGWLACCRGEAAPPRAARGWAAAMRRDLDGAVQESPEAALAAFHRACVNWGRALNGLPSLRSPPRP